MARTIPHIGLLAVLVLLLPACNDKPADPPKAAEAPAAKGPEAPVPAPAPTGKCDVTVSAGADGPAVTLAEGKTYCVGERRFTTGTRLAEARTMLGGCAPDEVLIGGTHLQCEGVRLSFAGPHLALSEIHPTAPAAACDVTVNVGADGPVVRVEAGKTYCVGAQRLTRDTTLDDARKALGDCRVDDKREGGTLLQCKGATVSFGGPVLVLSSITPTAS